MAAALDAAPTAIRLSGILVVAEPGWRDVVVSKRAAVRISTGCGDGGRTMAVLLFCTFCRG
jgi:hypothetical protein